MERQLTFSKEGRKKVLAGIAKAANAISVTLGAGGRNVLIERMTGYPVSTKDGVTVAKAIELSDRIENMGAMMVRESAAKTVDIAGDGTTQASLLVYRIIKYGLDYIEKDVINPIDFKRGMEKAVHAVVEQIKKYAKPADTFDKLKQIATVSANNDSEIGELIATAIDKVKRDGIVEVEQAQGSETTVELVEGMQLDRGYISPYFVNNEQKMKCELENPLILMYDKKINTVKDIESMSNRLLTEISKTAQPLLIICEDLGDEMLKTMIVNKMQNGFKVCAIKLPTFGGSKELVMEDIAILTHGQFITEKKGKSLKSTSISNLGTCDKVIITKDKTTIIGGAGGKIAVEQRCNQIRSEIESSEYELDKEKLKQRLSRLSNGVAIIRVGGATDGEIAEKKDRIDDAKSATMAAIDEGFIAGGGVTYVKCAEALSDIVPINESEACGIATIHSALFDPFTTILANAGLDSKDSLRSILRDEYGYGVNVKTGRYENLLKAGIIDPAKVARVALQNAASVAAIFLTTECVISNV